MLTLGELRRAVMLCHVLPGVRLRVWSGVQLVAEVGRGSASDDGEGPSRMTSCQARSVVAEAWQGDARAHRSLLLGLTTLGTPSVEVLLEPYCEEHPGGVYRVICARTWVYAFLTTLGVGAVTEAVEAVHLLARTSAEATALARRVDYHCDAGLGVTVLWVEVDQEPACAQEEAVLGLLHRLLAACAAREIDDDLIELLSQDDPLAS